MRAQIAQSDAKEIQALAQFDQTLLRALTELQQAWGAYQFRGQQVLKQHEALKHSQRSLALMQKAVSLGQQSHFSLLTQQRHNLLQQMQYIQTEANWIDAQIQLFKVLGGGWKDTQAISFPPLERVTTSSTLSQSPR